MLTDPSGEIIETILIGALISVITNGIQNSINGEAFFKGWGRAAVIGAIGGAFSFGIGEAASGITGNLFSTGISNASAFQFVAHGALGGVMSEASGGKFVHGFLSGGIGSAVGGLGGRAFQNSGNFGRFLGTALTGGIAGGIGSSIAGGSFWDGFRNGAISAGLNHAAHVLQQEIRPRKIDFSDDPEKVLRRVTKWARYVRNNPDADVYLSDMVKHYVPKRTFFNKFSDILSAGSPLTEQMYTYSNGDKIKLGYVTEYMYKGNNHTTRIEDIWFKGQIGNSNRYDIGFIGNSVSGGNSPTLFYINIYGESLYNSFKMQILNP